MDVTKYSFENEEIEILYLVYEDDDLIVWIDKDYDTDWRCKRALTPSSEKALHRTKALAAAIESIPNKHHGPEVKICFKRLIGEAIVCALKDDSLGAEKVIRSAEQYIGSRNGEISRQWTLRSNTAAGIIELGLIAVLWIFREWISGYWGGDGYLAMLAYFIGCLGAAASVIIRVGKEKTSPESGFELHILEILSRHFVGGISAVLLFALMKSGFVFSSFNAEKAVNIFGFSLLGGCSERIIPMMLSKIEQNKHTELGEKK